MIFKLFIAISIGSYSSGSQGSQCSGSQGLHCIIKIPVKSNCCNLKYFLFYVIWKLAQFVS